MIQSILIANRGEIAIRVIRTARDLGFRTVAVYSEPDKESPHVRAADEAVYIGGGSAADTYLSMEKIIDAARMTGADAVHPGYGFLSENADFVRRCKDAGIVFIGPGADAMELMGSKRLAKEAMQKAGVPCIPGYHGEAQSDAVLITRAESIGFPIMIKASAGGGGRGMRLVAEPPLLADAIRDARAEALSTFGSDELILEKAIAEPRHVEIQVFADTHGNAIHLGERDCSVQRRHQKVVEEAPSPFVDAALRRKMGEAAVNAVIACGYIGAGTVEFLVDRDMNFYFLEMNTRLQVEHPVTEMITGLDLVAWQIHVACGGKLPLSQDQVRLHGHAMEVRLYAEDARHSFLPANGNILAWKTPVSSAVRIDSGVEAGQEIGSSYDPLLAKIIAWGENREESRRRLTLALRNMVLLGLDNNKFFLERIINHPVFVEGKATTSFIEAHFASDISMCDTGPPPRTIALAAALLYWNEQGSGRTPRWRNPAPSRYRFRLSFNGHCMRDGKDGMDVALERSREQTGEPSGNRFVVTLPGRDEPVCIEWVHAEENSLVYMDGAVRKKAWFARLADSVFIDDGQGHFIIENITMATVAETADPTGVSGLLSSSMNGRIVEVLACVGDLVETGQSLLILESMKMQHHVPAAITGRIAEINVSTGDQVKPGQLLARLIPEQEKEESA